MESKKTSFELRVPGEEPAALHELEFLQRQLRSSADNKHVEADIAIDTVSMTVVITCTRGSLNDCIGDVVSPVSAQGTRKGISIAERKASA